MLLISGQILPVDISTDAIHVNQGIQEKVSVPSEKSSKFKFDLIHFTESNQYWFIF